MKNILTVGHNGLCSVGMLIRYLTPLTAISLALTRIKGKDYTLRTVFSHDHFGPSSHQQHGLYAALVIEPSNSVWLNLDSNNFNWNKLCGEEGEDAKKTERSKVLGGAHLAADFDQNCIKLYTRKE